MNAVEIRDDGPTGFLKPTLLDVLGVVNDIGPSLRWSILDVEGILNKDATETLPTIEQKVYGQPNGLVLGWDELLSFGHEFMQITDGWFIGAEYSVRLPERGMEKSELLAISKIFIEAFDATYWTVYLTDDSLVSRFESCFNDVKVVSSSPG